MLMRERNLAIIEEEETINKKLENRVAKMSEEQDRLKGEQNRMIQVRAAYNADKRALTERIQELESVLRQRDFDKQELEAKVNLLEQSAG
jgi:chromosome segregation ATPase